ncbi:MAG TPA: prolyl oligopeptidase family serine peptidase [Steroidobacteraceae bacterium]
MKRTLLPNGVRILSMAICAGSLICGSARSAPPPAEAFGNLPQIGNVAMNPKGDLFAWSDNSGATQKVVIFDLARNALKRTLDVVAPMKLRGIDWADDATVLIEVSETLNVDGSRHAREWFRTLSANVAGGPTRMLLMTGDRSVVTGSSVLALRTPRPQTIIMSSWDFELTKDRGVVDTRFARSRKDDGWVLNLFEVDTVTGKGRRLEQGTQFTDDGIIGADGQAVARSEWNPQQHLFRILRKDGMGWKEIYHHENPSGLGIHGLTADASAIVAVGALGEPRTKVWAIPLDGSDPKVLLEDPQFDVEAIVVDPYSYAPIGGRIGGPEPAVRWFDPDAQARHSALLKTFSGRNVQITGRSQDGSRAIAFVDSHSLPGIYYFVDFKKGTADIIGEDYAPLAGVPLGNVRAISYEARDGSSIPAYITLPPTATVENLPMVVLPHGGPESRDDTNFDWLAQFLATRGYLVFQPQFRGSTGFGDDYRRAGYHQWGGLMQDDITDGVKALIEQHLADPHRIAIVGASYGGYAALAGAAFTPDLYACAVSVGGVTDLPAMLGYSEAISGDESDVVAYWRVSIGAAFDANVIARSPARAAASIRAPILLLHGVDDTVVPIDQSEMMARALDKEHKQNLLLKLPGEDHWLSRGSTRIRVLTEIEKFLSAQLPVAGN